MDDLENEFLVKQCWYHYQDHYFPQPAKEVKKISDIYTNFKNIPIPMGNLNFLGLRIFARNSNKNEIAFIWERTGENVILNLDLDNYPSAPNRNSYCKHVKIEIDYILVPPLESRRGDSCLQNCGKCTKKSEQSGSETEACAQHCKLYQKEGPNIFEWIRKKQIKRVENGNFHEKLKIFVDNFYIRVWNFLVYYLDKYVCPKKTAIIEIKDITQPEFDIIIPKGWEIGNEGNDFFYVAEWVNSEGKTEKDEAKKEKPTVQWEDGKLRYNYLLNLKDGYYNAEFKEKILKFQYFSKLSWMYVLLSFIIPFLFFIFSISIFITADLKLLIPMKFEESLLLTYSVLVISYVFAYIGYLKDGFALPFQKQTAIFIGVTIAIIGLSIICVQHPIDEKARIVIDYFQNILGSNSNDILW